MAYNLSERWIFGVFIAILLCGLVKAATTVAPESTPEPTTTPPKAPLKVSTKVLVPYVIFNTSENATERFTGYAIDLLKHAMKELDMDYTIQEVKENYWGETIGPPEENRWTGIIGEAQRGDVDLAAAPITVTERRKKAVQFITPFDTVGTAALMRNDSDIQTQEQLLSSNFSIGVVKGSPIVKILRGSAKYAKLLSRINATPQLATLDEALAKVRQGQFALLMNNATADYTLKSSEPCNIIMANIDIGVQKYAFAVKNGSDIKQPLDAAFDKIIKSGTNKMLRDQWFAGVCGGGAQGLTLTYFVLILGIFGACFMRN